MIRHCFLPLIAFCFLLSSPAAMAEDLSALGVEPEIAIARSSGFKIQVTNTNDDGAGSLRQAIESAVEGNGHQGTVISFHRRLNGKTIALTSGQLEVPEDAPPIEITAADLPDGITVDAGGLSRVAFFDYGSVVRLQGLVFMGGQSPLGTPANTTDESAGENGGGILSMSKSLAIVDCRIEGNSTGDGVKGTGGLVAGPGGHGGGLAFVPTEQQGSLSVIRTTIAENRSGAGGDGGPSESALHGGKGGNGGGVYLLGSVAYPVQFEFLATTVVENEAGRGGTGVGSKHGGSGGNGGGIYIAFGVGRILQSSLVNNSGGSGGIGGDLAPGGQGGNGGGLYQFIQSELEIENSTVARNLAGDGGEKNPTGQFASSGDGGNGGGLHVRGDVDIWHGTISANSAGLAGGVDADDGEGAGIFNEGGDPYLQASLIGNNTGADDVTGGFSQGHGVIVGPVDLAPLGDYGGPTPTMPPMLDSIAIDVVTSRLRLPADQRGEARRGRNHDAGAIELDAFLRARLALDAGAPHFVVTRPSDSGPASLRDALEKAAAETALGAEHVVITFSPRLRGRTILLRSGALEATNDSGAIHVVAAAKAPEGNSLTAQIDGIVLNANYQSRILETTAGGEVWFAGLTLTKGEAQQGGGVWNEGDLTLEDCVISDNRVSPNRTPHGGGIYNDGGTLTLIGSRVSGNLAGAPQGEDGGSGGGIFSDGDVVVCESVICENRAGGEDGVTNRGGSGGGIYSHSGAAIVQGSTLSNNRAGSGGFGGNGGGLAAGAGSIVVSIFNSTLSGNDAGSGRATAGSGGGIFMEGAGTCSINGSTIADNVAPQGGLGNTSKGGGIYAEGPFFLTNSILAQNKAVVGANFIDENDSETPANNNDSVLGGSSIVYPLGDYGGTMPIMPPVIGGPAIGIADPFEGPSVDQRGTFRDQSEPADAGSVESDFRFYHFLTRVEETVSDAVDVWNDVDFEEWGEEGGSYTGLVRHGSGDVVGSIAARVSPSGVVSGNLVLGDRWIRTEASPRPSFFGERNTRSICSCSTTTTLRRRRSCFSSGERSRRPVAARSMTFRCRRRGFIRGTIPTCTRVSSRS